MQINLPQVGESVTEGVIAKWLCKVGDRVEKYDPLVEIVTDKVTMEMPSPVSGVLSDILVEDGQTVPMGAPIAHIESDSIEENSVDHQIVTKQGVLEGDIGRTGTLLKDVKPVGPTGSGGSDETIVDSSGHSTNLKHSPVVMRLASKHGISLESIVGTGLNGRITRKDVQSFLDSRDTSDSLFHEIKRTPLTPIRKMIATNMVRSSNEIPDAWTMVEVDVTGLVRVRESMKDNFRDTEGVSLTYLPFIVEIVAKCLKKHRLVNSSWDHDSVILKDTVNIGIAVATLEGLFVPVIHEADVLEVSDIAKAIARLTRNAQEGTLSVTEVQGATFTVNNTGALGSIIGKAIINYPQAAILNTEAIVKRPIVKDEEIVIRSMMNLCLTFDHRILDGSEASRFLSDVKKKLEMITLSTKKSQES